MNTVSARETCPIEITKPVMAIVMYGMPSSLEGFKPGYYFQVVLDPSMKSPGGEYIRCDQRYQVTELHGWQRIAALTVCEVLGDAPPMREIPPGYSVREGEKLEMRRIINNE